MRNRLDIVIVAGVILFLCIGTVQAGYKMKKNLNPEILTDLAVYKGEKKIGVGWQTVWYLKGRIKCNIKLVHSRSNLIRAEFLNTGGDGKRVRRTGTIHEIQFERELTGKKCEITVTLKDFKLFHETQDNGGYFYPSYILHKTGIAYFPHRKTKNNKYKVSINDNFSVNFVIKYKKGVVSMEKDFPKTIVFVKNINKEKLKLIKKRNEFLKKLNASHPEAAIQESSPEGYALIKGFWIDHRGFDFDTKIDRINAVTEAYARVIAELNPGTGSGQVPAELWEGLDESQQDIITALMAYYYDYKRIPYSYMRTLEKLESVYRKYKSKIPKILRSNMCML